MLALSACGENRIAQTVVEAYRLTIGKYPDSGLSRENVRKLPYASVTAKIGNGPKGLLVLWRQDRDDLHWISADGVALVTRFGRIVKTAGLPETIRNTLSRSEDPVAKGLQDPVNLRPYHRTVEFDDPTGDRFAMEIGSEFMSSHPETITIVEIEFDTVVVREINRGSTTNWSFENRYWVDPQDGFVWRSSQHIGRGFPPVVIEVTKPAVT